MQYASAEEARLRLADATEERVSLSSASSLCNEFDVAKATEMKQPTDKTSFVLHHCISGEEYNTGIYRDPSKERIDFSFPKVFRRSASAK